MIDLTQRFRGDVIDRWLPPYSAKPAHQVENTTGAVDNLEIEVYNHLDAYLLQYAGPP